MRKPPSRPKVGDPIVEAGVKHRVYQILPDRVLFKECFGRRLGWALKKDLTWDKVPQLWRTGR